LALLVFLHKLVVNITVFGIRRSRL